jgi:uncharacterized membrane protein (DUF4010 family)
MEEYGIDLVNIQLTQKVFFVRLLVATGIGFLIGLEREHSALNSQQEAFAGTRTFVFVVLLGFLGAMMNYLFSPWIFLGVLLAVVSFIAISYWMTSSRGDIGGTTEFSALLAFLLGGLTFLGHIELSLMITVFAMVLLSSKMKLQTLIGKITEEEMYALIRFVVLALLILPFLPDQGLGPFGVINPQEIGWIIILTSGLGFLGYLLIKFLGHDRGILLTGIVGGLVSSTMVTWIFAKKSKEAPALSSHCATAILAASSIMIIRVLVWVFIFNQDLAPGLYVPVGLIFLAGIGATLFFYFRKNNNIEVDTSLPPGKPLNMQSALTFGVIYTLIILLVSYTNEYFGQSGMYISSVIAGLTDIDAITISVSKLAGNAISITTAQNAIILATISNTVIKIGISLWAGSMPLRKMVSIGYGAIFAVAILAFLLLNI